MAKNPTTAESKGKHCNCRQFLLNLKPNTTQIVIMSIKLRDLIRAVRACKTAAEERAVISKECALIRTAIKEEDEQFRHRNVAKLMFIHMLGYPTHFGQMECLKLISAQPFPEKRIGYLALTLLLNEQNEVLTLVTNSLKLDLTNSNQYIVALALIAIGNLATQDMARDLISDVEKLLRSNNSYLRKKAALAMIRLLKKEPDLLEGMEDRIVALLKDRSHGVLLTGLQLIVEIIHDLPSTKEEYTKLVPSLVRLLRNFLSMGYSPEHDVSGITDPFTQVEILKLLRFLGKGQDEASEQMNDVLAQVATNTETTKNAGNAILYECVQTIMDVQSDSSLRVLAVNILGRFLLNRDNNIRYVALNSLSKVVTEDVSAVQRHRNTIVDCLKDPDISIRQRALDLIYQLVNDSNVVNLTNELLNYLVVAQSEHKASLASKIISIVEQYSPNKKWRVDTIITMLTIAGNITEESVPRTAIIFIAQADGLHAYATHRLYRALVDDSTQLGLSQVAIWCVGEYGNYLLQSCQHPENDTVFNALSEQEIIAVLDKCSKQHNADINLKGLVINALMKLSTRFSVSSRSAISDIISPYRHSMSLELQQRSSEYITLLGSQWEHLRRELLDKMPVLDEAEIRKRRARFEDGTFQDDTKKSAPLSPVPSSANFMGGGGHHMPAVGGGGNNLLDLDDIFGGGGAAPVVQKPAGQQQHQPQQQQFHQPATNPLSPHKTTHDLLSDIFSSSPAPMPMTANNPNNNMFGNSNTNNNAFGNNLAPPNLLQPQPPLNPTPSNNNFMPPAAPVSPVMPMIATNLSNQLTLTAFEKNGLLITLEVSKSVPNDLSVTKVICKFSNSTSIPLENFSFQVRQKLVNDCLLYVKRLFFCLFLGCGTKIFKVRYFPSYEYHCATKYS
jgi:AP-1 complex subunit gamma-1